MNEYFNYEHKKVLNPAVAKCLFKIMLINLENKNWNEFVNNLIKSFYISRSTFFKKTRWRIFNKIIVIYHILMSLFNEKALKRFMKGR